MRHSAFRARRSSLPAGMGIGASIIEGFAKPVPVSSSVRAGPEIRAATVERPRGMEDCTEFPDNAIRKRHSISAMAQSRISHAR